MSQNSEIGFYKVFRTAFISKNKWDISKSGQFAKNPDSPYYTAAMKKSCKKALTHLYWLPVSTKKNVRYLSWPAIRDEKNVEQLLSAFHSLRGAIFNSALLSQCLTVHAFERRR